MHNFWKIFITSHMETLVIFWRVWYIFNDLILRSIWLKEFTKFPGVKSLTRIPLQTQLTVFFNSKLTLLSKEIHFANSFLNVLKIRDKNAQTQNKISLKMHQFIHPSNIKIFRQFFKFCIFDYSCLNQSFLKTWTFDLWYISHRIEMCLSFGNCVSVVRDGGYL